MANERRRPPAALLRIANPLALAVAGQRWFPLWARLTHRGRTSGKEYVIPVAIVAVTDDRFVIGLPWGPQTNWVRNTIAAGGCTLLWRGHEQQLTDPVLIDTEAARQIATGIPRFVVGRGRFPGFLQLTRPPSAVTGH